MNPTAALVVLALVVAALAVVVGWLVWRSLRGMRAPVAWPAAACELGLTHEPPAVPDVGNPGTLAGGYRGREVLITTERRTGRTARTRIAIDLARPIGAGIALATDGARPALDADDDAPFATGHPTIDKRLAPRAADPARARRLFERKALRDAIADLAERADDLRLTDTGLTVYHADLLDSAEALRPLLDAGAELARLVEESPH